MTQHKLHTQILQSLYIYLLTFHKDTCTSVAALPVTVTIPGAL